MSTTNPEEGDARGAGRQWPEDAKDLSRGDDHGGGTGVDPASIHRGHEEDVSNISAIWSIPIAVAMFILLGIAVATGTFMYFMDRESDAMANPRAVAESQAGTNERFSRIGRAGQGKVLTDQPRLEGLQLRERDGMATSQIPLRTGNSPAFHAEDLRAEKQALLNRSGWIDAGKVARIPISDAMQISVKDHLFPVRKEPVAIKPGFEGAQQSNAGRGVPTAPAGATKKDH